jgi:hypothetical protein
MLYLEGASELREHPALAKNLTSLRNGACASGAVGRTEIFVVRTSNNLLDRCLRAFDLGLEKVEIKRARLISAKVQGNFPTRLARGGFLLSAVSLDGRSTNRPPLFRG